MKIRLVEDIKTVDHVGCGNFLLRVGLYHCLKVFSETRVVFEKKEVE